MLKFAVAVVAIALADWVNPSLIRGQLFVCHGQASAATNHGIHSGGVGGQSRFVFGFALGLGPGDLIHVAGTEAGSAVKFGLIVFAGIALVVGGAVVRIRRKALTGNKDSDDQPERHRPAALMGAGIAGLELLTAFPTSPRSR